MNLGKKLKQARLEKKLTQKELAKQIKRKGKNASNTTIANWESGLNNPDIDTLQVICDILQKDGNYFFADDIVNENDTFRYTVEDDAMYPILDIGDMAIIHKQNHITPLQENTTNCGSYLLKINGTTTIRDVFESSDKQKYTLRGRNVLCKPIEISKDDFNKKITVLGRVVRAELSSAFK